MRVRWMAGQARVRRRMAAVLCSSVAMFAALSVSACTGGSTPGAGASASSSFFTAKAPSGTATVITPSPSPSPSLTPSPSPSPSLTEATLPVPATTSAAPIGAPSTGGGGTAGLQHLTLFGLGGLAILAGLASLIYRRRLRDR
ncbi:MAG: hypothetical protein JO016_05420 [Actinobacteria bacterium]|nr:hypothetical protein [Actinomycetota bacterium]